MPMLLRMPVRSAGQVPSRYEHAPGRGVNTVVRMETVVVLPAPLGPSRQNSCPRGTSKLMPSTALLVCAVVALDQVPYLNG